MRNLNQLQFGDNQSYLLKVIEPWDENLVTWNTQPEYTFQNLVSIPTSTNNNQSYPDINVTLSVQDMITNPSSNYGWLLRLVTEELYKSMVFASSDNPVPEWRPTLTVIYKDCHLPIAQFNYTIQFPKVNFFDSSSSATAWYWSFGDGYYSTVQNPVHEYDSIGKYIACLEVTDSCGSAHYCDTIYYCHSPDTYFVYTIDDQFASFRDSSNDAISWFWDFGDGFFSNLRNPAHYFNDPGHFLVCLTSSTCYSQTYCDSIIVNAIGISELEQDQVKVYPNPAHEKIVIELQNSSGIRDIWITISDVNGIILRNEMIDNHAYHSQIEIDISMLKPGFYCLKLISGNLIFTKGLIIQR